MSPANAHYRTMSSIKGLKTKANAVVGIKDMGKKASKKNVKKVK